MIDPTQQASWNQEPSPVSDYDTSRPKEGFFASNQEEASHNSGSGNACDDTFRKEWDPSQEDEPLFSNPLFPSRPPRSPRVQAVLSLVCSLFMLALIGLAGYGVFCLAVGSREDFSSSFPSGSRIPSLGGLESDQGNSSQTMSSDSAAYSSQSAETASSSAGSSQGGSVEAPLIQPPVVTGPKLPIVVEQRPEETSLSSSLEEQNSVPLSTVEIAKKVRPSVVGILTYEQNQTAAVSQGSGLILSEDGYIITNAHVVSGADGINVVLSNDEEYEGVLVGIDNKTDIAVVKIDAHNLYPAAFGDSDQLEVGESVVAVGNPGGLELAGSVTQGIVSAVDRPVRTNFSAGYTIRCIQTDAAINPGNSGGPLVDCYGRVVGINSAKIATADYEGIGFAIPMAEVLPIVQDLVRYGRVTGRVWLGIGAVVLNEVQAKLNNLPTGLLISMIYPDSNLSQAGVQLGDVLQKIDGRTVGDLDQLREVLDEKKPGDKAVLTLYRPAGSGGEGEALEVAIYLIEDTDGWLGTTS